MDSIRGDEHVCVWCGEPLDPEDEGLVVVDEDERCYAEHPENYYDPATRVVPRAYGHTACLLESIQMMRNEILQDVKTWWEAGESLDLSVKEIHEGLKQAREQDAAADDAC
jgi:hypothetical protein